MSKKDYELIAAVIKDEYKRQSGLAEYHTAVDERITAGKHNFAALRIATLSANLAFKFEQYFPRFDAEKFRDACGIED